MYKSAQIFSFSLITFFSVQAYSQDLQGKITDSTTVLYSNSAPSGTPSPRDGGGSSSGNDRVRVKFRDRR